MSLSRSFIDWNCLFIDLKSFLESRASQTANRGLSRECGDLLPRSRQYLFGPELSQSQSLGHFANAGSKGCLRHGTCRCSTHRNYAYTNKSVENGK